MKLSVELQKKFDDLGITKKNVLYLPIAREPLDRIRNKTKIIEFRELSDFYLKKMGVVKDNVYIEDKPLKYVLFQNGYGLGRPRMLIELKEWAMKEKELENPNDPKTKLSLREAEKEGYEPDDEYIGIFLGEIVHEENF